MKFLLGREKEKIFFHEGAVELDPLVSEEALPSIIYDFLHLPGPISESMNVKDPLFRKIKGSTLIHFALQLSQKEALRLGFSALIQKQRETTLAPFTLSDSSFASHPLLGFLMALQLPEESAGEGAIPASPGGGLFFTPQKSIDLSFLPKQEEALFLLLTFTTPRSRYIKPQKEFFPEPLKKMGYSYGDSLEDFRHPLFHRTH